MAGLAATEQTTTSSTTRGWLLGQPRALDPPAWSPRPGPSAASWGASCFAGAAPVLAPACPACGSPTEVRVGVPCSCACPWEPQTLQLTQQWGPSQPRAICSASWRDAVTPCIARGKDFTVIPWDGALTATSGRRCGRRRGERQVLPGRHGQGGGRRDRGTQDENLRGLLRKGERQRETLRDLGTDERRAMGMGRRARAEVLHSAGAPYPGQAAAEQDPALLLLAWQGGPSPCPHSLAPPPASCSPLPMLAFPPPSKQPRRFLCICNLIGYATAGAGLL